jgi:lipoprotein
MNLVSKMMLVVMEVFPQVVQVMVISGCSATCIKRPSSHMCLRISVIVASGSSGWFPHWMGRVA